MLAKRNEADSILNNKDSKNLNKKALIPNMAKDPLR